MKSFRFYIDIKAENKEEAQSKLEESDGYSPDFDNLECIELQIEYPIDKQTMTEKIFITDEEFKKLSSQIAEKEHHESCEFECCGSHEDFVNYLDKKCSTCGMTEEIQDKHNDQVWSIIDSAEADLLDKYSIMWKHEDPEDCNHSDYMEDLGKMQSDNLEGVYNIPFFCSNCNHFVKEVYNYEGVEVF